MLKKITLVMFSVFMLAATNAMADDDLLNELASGNGPDIADASVEVEDFSLDIDVDELAADADGEEDAVEACFRRFGYRSWGFRSYGYGYGYNCYRPAYSYSYYRPLLCQPVYHTYSYCAPIVSHYWGCY